MAGRTGPSFRGSYYPSSEGSRIRSRKRFHPGTSLGGQTKSQIQRRGAAATRRCSVSRFPSFRKNLIIPRAPAASWGIPSSSPARLKPQATSNKLFKAQAPSCSRCKRQASSPKQQASSFKPQAASSRTWLPVYSLTSLSFECLAARDFIKIKEFLGCLIWKLIWWGERRTALLTVTFSSTVKNTLFLLYPNRSGVPKELEFSILVHKILGVNFFHSCQNFASGFRVIGLCCYRSYY